MDFYRMGFKVFLGLCLVVALAACSSKGGDDDDDDNGTGGGAAPTGTGGAGPAGGTGGKSPTGSGGMGTVGGSGTGGKATNSGGSGGTTTAGTGGTTIPADDGGVSPTAGFLKDCKQGGAAWGTPEQLGPCASGVTTYGVKTEFGPYGVRTEQNVGVGFETGGTDDSAFCNAVFIPSFGADPVGSADLMDTHDLDFELFTVFYPGIMPEGEKFPLITWGNGTCAMPEGYGPLLRYVASFGYIIVAANNRAVGSGTPQTKGLDFMLAENAKADSKFFEKIDADKIGAMGHSQGAMGTVAAASDPRIKAIIAFNSGTSTAKPFLNISGDNDLGAGTDPSSIRNSATASQQPAAWLWYHQVPEAVNGSTTGSFGPGHLTLMMESERVNEPTVAWWDMMLKDSADAKKMFVGDACTLCDGSAFASMWSPFVGLDSPSLEYGHNALLQ